MQQLNKTENLTLSQLSTPNFLYKKLEKQKMIIRINFITNMIQFVIIIDIILFIIDIYKLVIQELNQQYWKVVLSGLLTCIASSLFLAVKKYRKEFLRHFNVSMAVITSIIITVPSLKILEALNNYEEGKSDNLINLGMTITTYQIFMRNLNIDWKIKGFITLWTQIYEIALLGQFSSLEYWENLLIRLLIQAWLCKDDFQLQKDQRQFLHIFQNKLKEDYNWKSVIQRLSEGVMLMQKDKKIIFQNRPVNTIFGKLNRTKTQMRIQEQEKRI